MCGVIGVSLQSVTDEDIKLVKEVFRQSMIRGKHATGMSWVMNNRVHTIKEPSPVDIFLKMNTIEQCINEDGGLYMIGHIRYSTSDLRYNQPMDNDEVAIAHNGVINQQPRDQWEYETETGNDSELILRSIEAGNDPLVEFADRSMAVCELHALSLIHI